VCQLGELDVAAIGSLEEDKAMFVATIMLSGDVPRKCPTITYVMNISKPLIQYLKC